MVVREDGVLTGTGTSRPGAEASAGSWNWSGDMPTGSDLERAKDAYLLYDLAAPGRPAVERRAGGTGMA